MCTAVSFLSGDHYFGRTLDHDCSFGESVVITPRQFPLRLRNGRMIARHHAMIGMAHLVGDMPLYYDAVNEKGLAIAGLRFADSAYYQAPRGNDCEVAVFELIPFLLGSAATVEEARELLNGLILTDVPFSPELPPAPLHFLLSDGVKSLVIEPVREGVRLYDNPVGVLTNEPAFPEMLRRLADHRKLTAEEPENLLAPELALPLYSRGMGAVGLPGDLSSPSRFIRAAFTARNAQPGKGEEESVNQLFHVLGTVEQVRGCCRTADGGTVETVYTSCCNATQGIYYYATYGCRSVVAVSLWAEELEGKEAISYPLITKGCIYRQNG